MEEGRQIEAGSATEASSKVVRLPRDWLGPRDDLVPFGLSTSPAADPEPAEFAPDDFWGERAAAIHSAVQAPQGQPPQDRPADDPPEPASHSRLGRRRLAAAAVVGIATAAAVVLLAGGSHNHAPGGARLNIAAIVSSGVSRILKAGPPRVAAPATSHRTVRQPRHRVAHHKPAPPRPQHHSSPPPPSTYVAHASSPSPHPTYHPAVASPAPRIVTSARRGPSTTSSGATVTPTGQNGALGPVQSPNG